MPGRWNLPARRIAAVTFIALAMLASGCRGEPASIAPASASAATAPPSQPADAGTTFPPSQTRIEPGTYRWNGFKPPISITVGLGWQLGHDNAAFFDLFRGSDFPSVSFARFPIVYANATTQAGATDAASVLATFSARSDLTLTASSSAELGGLQGRVFDVVTAAPRTPLFYGPAGDFRLDPDFKTRYRILDVPGGGILVVGIHTRVNGFEAGLALGEAVVESLTVEP